MLICSWKIFIYGHTVLTRTGVNCYLTVLQLVLTQLFSPIMHCGTQEIVWTPSLNMLQNGLIHFSFLLLNHYAPVNQTNWCNMTFYSWKSLPLSFMHRVTRVKPPLGFEPGSSEWEADDLPTELSLPLWFNTSI